MSPQDMRGTLIERTIQVVASDGIDKATTKAIVAGTGINEAYIYRRFLSKDDLLARSFENVEQGLVDNILKHMDVMSVRELDYETRCRAFFMRVWKFMLGNKEKCLFYVRYYYSPYFLEYSIKEHMERYKPVVEEFKLAFTEETDAWMILNHILNVMLDFAVKVHNGQMPDEDIYAELVFRVVYASTEQYFKKTEEIEEL